jgi:RNA polymerase sigma-70 factor (family 1)
MKPEYQHTEAELVAALNRGDKNAFEIIYRTHASDIFRHIQRNVPRREDCEEILQDLFEFMWKNRERLQPGSLRSYLLTGANRRVLMYFRKNKAKRNYEKHFMLFEAMFDYLHGEDQSGSIDPKALENLLRTSLDELPERCQEAFRLRLKENLSNTEIAQRMNIKKTTVENYMVRALNHLHQSYQSLYEAGRLPSLE